MLEKWATRVVGSIIVSLMPSEWSMLFDGPELAVDAAAVAERADLGVACEVSADPLADALALLKKGKQVALGWGESTPSPQALCDLADAALAADTTVPIALVAADRHLQGLARDIGLAAVSDIGPLVAACAIMSLPSEKAWTASTHRLCPADRQRMGGEAVGRKETGAWVRLDEGLLGHASTDDNAIAVGPPADTASACAALRYSELRHRPKNLKVSDVDPQAIRDVILGPPRALSDPASKAALINYDVPLPLEELCVAPSRAASEAARIGFPVRIALASPDLRVWDHPDLVVHDVENAARAREAYRQIIALAAVQSPKARLLGVTVSAASTAAASLRVHMTPLGGGAVHTRLSFADAHGLAADDLTETLLPTTPQGLEHTLNRLQGASLLLSGNAKERRQAVSELGDVLLRLAAFAHDWRDEITSIEVNPLVRLVTGEYEIQEACVVVGDAFTKSLQASG